MIPLYFNETIKGEFYFNEKSISDMKLYEISEKIGSVFQNPRSQFFNVDTTGEMAFECENLGMPVDEIHQRIEQTIKDFHMKN